MVVTATREPDVPLTVMVALPVTAVLLAVKVRIVPEVDEVGLNVAVTPLGSPLAEKDTLLVKPPDGITLIADVPLAPWLIVTLLGLAESPNAAPEARLHSWYVPPSGTA